LHAGTARHAHWTPLFPSSQLGPLEPFDDSFPALLKNAGVYSHLISDHYHYFEDGGATYHTRHVTWEFIRGQETDPWIAVVKPPIERFREWYHPIQFEDTRDGHGLQGMLNCEAIRKEEDFPCVQCFDAALRFLEQNGSEDDWLLQLETFDPHEPFFAPDLYKKAFPTTYEGPTLDWPRYRNVQETTPEIEELRTNYAALVALCDAQLGRILDSFDANGRWNDTAIVLTTDHGFLLTEDDWWAKNRMPFYNEIANIPLFIYHPEHRNQAGRRVSALTQTSDVMPTLLDLFGMQPGPDVLGRSMLQLSTGEKDSIRNIALYGIFGRAINATDGRYTYFRYPEDIETKDLYEYTLMPMHNRSLFEIRELENATLHHGFDFAKGAPLLRLPALPDAKRSPHQGGFSGIRTVLYDLEQDPHQTSPIDDLETERRMVDLIVTEMKAHDAPIELYNRFGFIE
jgi:arylsulfatase A-like enzyme